MAYYRNEDGPGRLHHGNSSIKWELPAKKRWIDILDDQGYLLYEVDVKGNNIEINHRGQNIQVVYEGTSHDDAMRELAQVVERPVEEVLMEWLL